MLRLVVLFVALALAVCQGLPSRLTPRKDTNVEVVGGLEVDIKDFPWQISMQYFGSLLCGGSILNSQWILTAGHCVDAIGGTGNTGHYVMIRAGSSFRSSGGQLLYVKYAVEHPKFDINTLVYDVALLQLSELLGLDGIYTKATTLPAPNTKITPGQLLTVSGWGTLHSGDYDLPEHLMAVAVPNLPLEICRQSYSTVDLFVDETMICAGVQGKDSCQGDSGGPIVDEQDVQVGVVSWGKGCAAPGFPGIYSNLLNTALSAWVKKTAGLGN